MLYDIWGLTDLPEWLEIVLNCLEALISKQALLDCIKKVLKELGYEIIEDWIVEQIYELIYNKAIQLYLCAKPKARECICDGMASCLYPYDSPKANKYNECCSQQMAKVCEGWLHPFSLHDNLEKCKQ